LTRRAVAIAVLAHGAIEIVVFEVCLVLDIFAVSTQFVVDRDFLE
jgi:hypothetical protein